MNMIKGQTMDFVEKERERESAYLLLMLAMEKINCVYKIALKPLQ